MRKRYLFLLCLLTFISCEKDDFCIDNPVTPQLILRFYDHIDKVSLKSANNLYVWAEGKDSLFMDISTDSLVIPLNSNANQTIYNFSSGDVINQFTVDYSPKNEYVSRSCGFKVVFENVNFSSDNTWILDYSSNTTIIENQNEAHVQIFH